MIHCIGDSHAAVFCGKEEMQPVWPTRSDDKIEYFRSYRIGAATAYQLETKVGILNDIIYNQVDKSNDIVMFCFGEVDIRAHLIKQSQIQNESFEKIVSECVDRYCEVVLNYKVQGYRTAIWGPIASWHPSKEYTGGPSYGSHEERNLVTKMFNEKLKDFCSDNDIIFVTFFYNMIDNENETNPYYLDDWDGSHIHLSQTAMPEIIQIFQNSGLI